MKKSSSGTVKARPQVHNDKKDKESSNEDFIKEKVSKKSDIYGLVNGCNSDTSLPVGRLKKKSVENGKHLYSDVNNVSKESKESCVIDRRLNHSDGVKAETDLINKNKSSAVSTGSLNHTSETHNHVSKKGKTKNSRLSKKDSNDNLSKDTNDEIGPISSDRADIDNILDRDNSTSLDTPKRKISSDIIIDTPCTEQSIASSSKSSLTCDETVNSEVVEKLENLSLQASLTEPPGITSEEPKELPPICYVQYENELQMPMIMKIIQKDLSEPYSIYTYRYFIHNWPKLCFLAMSEGNCVGAIVCKLDLYRKVIRRGYIAMLAVDKNYRKRGIGSTLVRKAIQEMIKGEADEVVLETEITNKPALRLYEALGFVRDKRLFRYYLNGVDALRLKLWLR